MISRSLLPGKYEGIFAASDSNRPSRFNVGQDQDENSIVTSTGQYVIAWDFAKVKKGQMDKYEIKK